MGTLLGLDASSTQIGAAIFEKDSKQLIKLDYLILSEGTILQKAEEFNCWLQQLIIQHNIDEMVIEQAYIAMYGGNSSAYTTALLNQMNALYQYIAFKNNLKVNTITVATCRKAAFPELRLLSRVKAGGKSQKQQIFERAVLVQLGSSYFPTKVLSRGPNKGKQVFEDWALDMSDAYVVGLGFLNLKRSK